MRTIVIGDIHGCFDELVELLDRVDPKIGDVVVSVGDLVEKGPHPARCIDLWISRGYSAVLGNNEVKVLRRPADLRSDHFEFLSGLPLFLDFAKLSMCVVHGGVLPGTRISAKGLQGQERSILTLRHIRFSDGKWHPVPKGQQRKDDPFWADIWDGERLVVYGHAPTPGYVPRVRARTIGIDTGCVYGGSLTAAIFEEGKAVSFVSIKARRVYAQRGAFAFRHGVFNALRAWVKKK